MPPTKANANGRKPAARRDCESDTASERCSKRNGTSIAASTASEPPSTNGAQRRRQASAASGNRISAATATAPLRANTSGARW